jgi:imidazolonepropionase-like amidohydrolase
MPTTLRCIAWTLGSWIVSLFTAVSLAATASSAVFRDITVIDVTRGASLPGRDVIVSDGKIESITKSNRHRARTAAGHTAIDGHGKFLLPGFIDMHVHLNDRLRVQKLVPAHSFSDAEILSTDNLTAYPYNGITTLQVMHGAPEMLKLRDAIAHGDASGPRLVVSSPRLDGLPPADPLVRIIASAAEGTAVVDEMKLEGYDFIKVYSELGQPAYDAIIERAHHDGLRVDGHLPRFLPLEHGLQAQDHIAHMEEFVYFAKTFDAAEIAQFTRQVKQSGVGITPTLIVFKNVLRSVADLNAVLARSDVRYVDPISLFSWQAQNNGYRSETFQAPQMLGLLQKDFEFMRKLTLAFHQAGIPMTVGTDASTVSGTVPGVSFHDEMAELVGVGISAPDVIRMATLEGAKAMRMDSQLGTADVGKVADLVMLDANPLVDIENARRVAGVMLAGHWIPKSTLDENMTHTLEHYKKLDGRLGTRINRQ